MNRKIKNIIIVFILFLIILILLLIFLQNQKNKMDKIEEKLAYINSDEWNDETYPNGMPKLFRTYKGKLTAQNMGKSIYYFTTEVIPSYYSKLKEGTNDEISSYYQSNSGIIEIDTGINNKQDFQQLILSIQKLQANELILDSFKIDKDNIKSSGNYTDAILYITYEESDEIGFNVRIYNNLKENSSSLVYTAL